MTVIQLIVYGLWETYMLLAELNGKNRIKTCRSL